MSSTNTAWAWAAVAHTNVRAAANATAFSVLSCSSRSLPRLRLCWHSPHSASISSQCTTSNWTISSTTRSTCPSTWPKPISIIRGSSTSTHLTSRSMRFSSPVSFTLSRSSLPSRFRVAFRCRLLGGVVMRTATRSWPCMTSCPVLPLLQVGLMNKQNLSTCIWSPCSKYSQYKVMFNSHFKDYKGNQF